MNVGPHSSDANYAACRCGADSFCGGILAPRAVVLVSAVPEQLEQTNTWMMVIGSSSDDRDQLISRLQVGQVGGSRCSSEVFSLSTMVLPFLLGDANQFRADLKTMPSAYLGGAFLVAGALGPDQCVS